MDNPWKDLGLETDSWVLPKDRPKIADYNQSQRNPETRIATQSIPEPFIGNPESAGLVLLGLNPGHSESDTENHRNPNFRNAMLLNLKHEFLDYPFYPLNPAFSHTGAGQFWNKKLGPLRKEAKLSDAVLSQLVMVIEWFPYHSERSGLPKKKVCESQEYSFFLARQMSQKDGVIVLGMRSEKHWKSLVPALRDVPFLRNPQNPSVSRGNMDEGLFEKILKSLGKNAEQPRLEQPSAS